MTQRTIIHIAEGIARHPLYRMESPINFTLNEGEQLAIVGPNGSGKTLLVNTIIGRYPLLMNEVHYDFGEGNEQMAYENIRYIAFRDSYGDYDSGYYYQQRWHSLDVENLPTARDLFAGYTDEELQGGLFSELGIPSLLNKQLVMLSSGEMRRIQIAKALVTAPQVLIIDNPFIGLDREMRAQLHDLLQRLIEECGLHLILVLSREEEIPAFVTHVIPVDRRVVGLKVPNPVSVLGSSPTPLPEVPDDMVDANICTEPPCPIIEFRDVTLRYGGHTIFEHLDWTVHRGEHWALHGRNGSGKSALLALVCADNPQSYACDISLFGCRRGTGESIWDIKRRIGYVSPEMHRAYLKDLPAIEIVASGLHDSIGLYKRPRPEQMGTCLRWMAVFGIESLAQRTFLTLSSGEQRLVLLARAFVKDPELLVLDEPLHGLDTRRRELVRDVIAGYCSRPEKTLIMVTHYAEELPSCITHHKWL